MTKTLILMRHAKSSWDDLHLSDHDRPLNNRGQRSAKALGDWLRGQEDVPDEAILSSSKRTVETMERLGLNCKTTVTRKLYHAGPEMIMDILRSAGGDTVLILAHNPGIAEFAERIVAAPPSHERFHDYPTGATLIARFDIDAWKKAAWHKAQAAGFVIPRELDT